MKRLKVKSSIWSRKRMLFLFIRVSTRPLALLATDQFEASSGKWCDTLSGSRLVLSVTFYSHHRREKDQLKFKSVVCEQNSTHPVIKRAFYERAKIVYSQIAERVNPLPGLRLVSSEENCVSQNSAKRGNYCKATWHVGQPPIQRASNQRPVFAGIFSDMWLDPAGFLPPLTLTQEQHFIDSFPVQGKTWALPSIWCAFTALPQDYRPKNRTPRKKPSLASRGSLSMSNQTR